MTSTHFKSSVISILVPALFASACVSSLTPGEMVELEYERVERQEAIRTFVSGCENAGRVVVYRGPVYNKLRDPIRDVPRHAHLSDYSCDVS